MSGSPATSASVAAELATALRLAGAELVFGVPGGGSNLDMVGAAEAAGMRFVLTHAETAATIMAGVAAELTGRPSAALATRGPGAASAVNGCAQALLDRQPVLVITDCVTAAHRARVSHQRLDQQALFAASAKRSVVLTGADTAASAKAVVDLALAGRPGPVHIDIDPTATGGPLGVDEAAEVRGEGWAALERARQLLRGARRPVVVAGVGTVAVPGGRRAATVTALRRFVEDAGIPVLTTYKARGVVADRSHVAAGVATGATIEAPVLADADLIVGVGFDPVELISAPWPYPAPIVLVNGWPIDDSDFFGDRVEAEVVGDIASALAELRGDISFDGDRATGARYASAARERLAGARPPAPPTGVAPQDVVTVAREEAPAGTIATVDAGAHMLPAMALWAVDEPGEVIVSSGLATMGFALPAAVAAALVHRDRHVVCFTGDGGLGMVLAELETLARLGLRVVVVVFNDATLSLIAAKQRPEGHGGNRAVSYAPVDFAAIGAAFGLASARCGEADSYRLALRAALQHDGPTVLDVTVDPRGYPALLDAIRGGPRPANE